MQIRLIAQKQYDESHLLICHKCDTSQPSTFTTVNGSARRDGTAREHMHIYMHRYYGLFHSAVRHIVGTRRLSNLKI